MKESLIISVNITIDWLVDKIAAFNVVHCIR